ncbi:cell wall hydrolase [Qipengyuania sp. GH29]|nr:cell wall hydrolase [Qipengyuania sphaerica]MBX7542123.1 cell wall hydrolase [Qipengyuania sphaerica]
MLVPQEKAEAMARLAPQMQADLADMTTSAEAESTLVEIDEGDALAKNLAIPTLGGRIERVGRFAGIPMSSNYYGTATDCLAQAVYYEAALEPEQGQRAVAQVVLNRVRHPAYPNTVCGVVYQGWNQPVCQFSFTCDGALMRKPQANLWRKSLAIARDALGGREVSEVGTATHYHADYVVPYWAFRMGKLATIGRHIFYRFPGSPGRAASFYGNWAGREFKPQVDFARFLAKDDERIALAAEAQFTPGLTVVPDVTDRHAKADVGGRIDTTKTWRLTIPDPVQASAGYRETLSSQGAIIAAPAPSSEQVQ